MFDAQIYDYMFELDESWYVWDYPHAILLYDLPIYDS